MVVLVSGLYQLMSNCDVMSQKPIAQKLLIKEGYKVLFLNNPADYLQKLGKLPEKVTTSNDIAEKPFNLIQLFAHSKSQLEQQLPKMKSLLEKDGLLWVTYLKGKAEFNRDTIRDYASSIGFQAVFLVAIDETWSAIRLKIL